MAVRRLCLDECQKELPGAEPAAVKGIEIRKAEESRHPYGAFGRLHIPFETASGVLRVGKTRGRLGAMIFFFFHSTRKYADSVCCVALYTFITAAISFAYTTMNFRPRRQSPAVLRRGRTL